MNADIFDTARRIVVLGPSIRTSHRDAARDIPALWHRFMTEGLLQSLPRVQDDASVYAVYCDYESDASGPYTMVLGVGVDPAVAADRAHDAALRQVTIPAGRYARFEAKGDPAQVVWQTWAHVAAAWERRAERRYVADYERYALSGLASMAAGYVETEIVVGLR